MLPDNALELSELIAERRIFRPELLEYGDQLCLIAEKLIDVMGPWTPDVPAARELVALARSTQERWQRARAGEVRA